MFDRGHSILAISMLGAITAANCTPVLRRPPGKRCGPVAVSAKTDSTFSRCAQATNPIDTVTPASEPFGVVEPHNPNHLVISWMQRARFGVTVLRSAASFDGGDSWPYLTTLPLTSCATRAPFSFHTAGDPWLAWGENGPIYASGLSFTEDSASGIAVTTSGDGGRSWQRTLASRGARQRRWRHSRRSKVRHASRARTSLCASLKTSPGWQSIDEAAAYLSRSRTGASQVESISKSVSQHRVTADEPGVR